MSPEQQTVTPTPGVDRLIRFAVGGHTFAFRRPSRADVRDAWALFVRLLAAGGETNTLNYFDGGALHWEARLEIGLRPRVRGAETLNLGEEAPAHWLRPIVDAAGKVVGHAIDFTNVDVHEFETVTAYLADELKKKAPSAPATSTATAPDPTSA